MQRILATGILFFCIGILPAQTVILEHDVQPIDTSLNAMMKNLQDDGYLNEDNAGPDDIAKQKFIPYILLGTAITLPAENSIDIVPLSTFQFRYGFSFLYKPVRIFGIGTDVAYHFIPFRLYQKSGKTFPDTLLHDREFLRLNALDADPYLHFNFTPKAYNMGKFLDIGASLEWIAGSNIHAIDKDADGSETEVIQRKLAYVQPFEASAFARLGINIIALTARYRLTGVFKPSYGYPEFPKLSLGLEVHFQ